MPRTTLPSALRSTRPPAAATLLLASLALATWAWSAPAASAAESGTSGAPSQAQGPGATPREAMRGFLEAARSGDFAAAASFLDLGELPEEDRSAEGPTLARHLKVVLDQKLWVDLDALSDDPEGLADDARRPDLDLVGAIRTKRGDVDVLLRREPEGPEAGWRIAPSTVRRIPALYEEFGYGALGEILPEPFFSIRVLEVELWQWIGVVLLVLLSYGIAWLAAGVLYRTLRRLARRTETDLDDLIVDLTKRPARWILALLFFSLGSRALRLSAPVHGYLRGIEIGLAVVLVSWLLMRLLDVFAAVLRRRFESTGRKSLVSIISLGSKTGKFLLVLLAAVAMLQNFGFNVTGLLAGLGVGGLAVALAAQKTVENLFGGVTLTADQPVRVGDFCRFGDKTGTVEEVGLRSTRVRTLDRTIITVPNAEFSQVQIENYAARDRIRLACTLALRYETTPDQLRLLLTELRKLLAAHPKVDADPVRVRFVAFGASSLDVEVFAYVRTQDFNEFLAVREDVFLRIMEIVKACGSGFAFPSQTLYLGRDGGPDAARARAAEQTVKKWREEGTLPFPDLPPDLIASIDDSLDYPPEGSAPRSPGTKA